MALPLFVPNDFGIVYLGFAVTVVLGLLTLYAASISWRAGVRFELSPDGIARLAPEGSREMLRWEEIAAIRERPFFQRLDLVDAHGRRRMKLPYQLEGFPALAEELALRTRTPVSPAEAISLVRRDAPAGAKVFHRIRSATMLPLVIAPLAPLVSIYFFGGVLILFALIFVVALVGWSRTWHRIRVEPERIVVRYPLRSRRFPRSEIFWVALDAGADEQAQRITVDLYLASGDLLKLRGCREGAVPLFKALHDLWQADAQSGARSAEGAST